MANNVRRCSSQERRLWTCSRSKRGTPQDRREASICSGPRAPGEIQTLSAENSLGGPLSLVRPYPITFWDEPYMGEESIRRPPESKKAPITCAQASRAIGSLPTLKVIQLPSPTAGSSSPVEGIGLPSTRACWEDASCGWNSAEALIAAKPRSRRRRPSGDICVLERPPWRGAGSRPSPTIRRSPLPFKLAHTKPQKIAALQDFDQAQVRSRRLGRSALCQ